MNEPRRFRLSTTTLPLLLLGAGLLLSVHRGSGAPASALKDVAYRSEATLTEYEQQRCRLDLYLPTEQPAFATLVWFHGGGMTGGTKDDGATVKIAQSLARVGVAVAASPSTPPQSSSAGIYMPPVAKTASSSSPPSPPTSRSPKTLSPAIPPK